MTTAATYNGWTSYETWLVKLWMDNDYGMYEWQKELADGCEDTYELSQSLENWLDELRHDTLDESGLFADLLGAAISEINWHEIAESIWEDTGRGDE